MIATGTATIVRNQLVKYWGATRGYSLGHTSAYDDYQILRADMPADQRAKLKKQLKADGWEEREIRYYGREYPMGGQLAGRSYHKDHNVIKFYNRETRVDIQGPKKAKPLTVPVYD